MRLARLIALCLILAFCPLPAWGTPADEKFFEEKVRPVLVASRRYPACSSRENWFSSRPLARPEATYAIERLMDELAAETGMDPAYASRSATGQYRTTPLRGLQQHAPYFHDGSAPDLLSVVEHYDRLFRLNLTTAQKADLVQYLKSL